MKKKTLIIFIGLIGILLIPIFLSVTGSPGYSDAHENCHTVPGGYTISVNVNATNSANPSETITIEITATGPSASNLFVQAPFPSQNNNDLQITPTTSRILDGSADDDDSNADAMLVTFTITVPEDDGFYYFLIIAGDNVAGQPDFAYIEIGFSVGGVSAPKDNPFDKIFDHLGLYLGLPALILVSVATVLVLLNENKFVKLHGIFAGSAWILTVINVIAAVIKIPTQAWLEGYELIYHLPHIIFGAIGLVTGFFSMLFGIAAERKPAKITGYLTLVFWWMAFVTGFLLNSNLLLL